MKSEDWARLSLLSVLWGGSYFFVALAVREIPPLAVVALRAGVAALVLGTVLKIRGETWRFASAPFLPFLAMALLNNMIPFSLLFWAQTMIASGLPSILIATTPFFSLVIAHFVLADERLRLSKLLGIGLGVAGVFILFVGDLLAQRDAAFLGVAGCLAAALSYGCASVYGRRFKNMNLSALPLAFGQLVATSAVMIPIVCAIEPPWQLAAPSLTAMAAVLALALASTAVAYILFFQLLASAGAVHATLVTLLVPPSAVLLGTLFLGEKLALPQLAGMVLIGLGLLSIDGRLFGRGRRAL